MTGFLQFLGVTRRLNAAGSLTRLGGALMEPEVLRTMEEAAASLTSATTTAALAQAFAAWKRGRSRQCSTRRPLDSCLWPRLVRFPNSPR
jgi:hypothetical protein